MIAGVVAEQEPSAPRPNVGFVARVGRNEPCPCGSGRKHKRCCLAAAAEAGRRASAAAAAYGALADLAWERFPELCASGFDAYFAPLGRRGFGGLGPDFSHESRAQAWYLFEPRCGPDGQSLHAALSDELGDAAGLLAGAAVRLWRLGDDPVEAGWAAATCPLSGERTMLRRSGQASATGLIAARTVELGPGRALAFGPALVASEVEAELVERARELVGRDADDRAWTSRGGELLRLASTWPEVRVRTREGELVQAVFADYRLSDVAAAIDLLERDPELGEVDSSEAEALDEGERAWSWRPPDTPPAAAPEPEPGIRWRLDLDDAEHRRAARVAVDSWEELLVISAATRTRLEAAERHLRRRLGPALGARLRVAVDRPDVTPRWQAERLEALFRGLERVPDRIPAPQLRAA